MRFGTPSKYIPVLLPRYILLLYMILFGAFYFITQQFIGSRISPSCGLEDVLFRLTAPINEFLISHPKISDFVLVLYSLFGDLSILFLAIFSIWTLQTRPILAVFLFLALRQWMQLTVSLPISPGLIWHDPGFPSLFSHYDINHDFYFAAYIGISVIANYEISKLKYNLIKIFALAVLFYQIFASIVLRSHFTVDIYTAIVTAIAVYLLARKTAPFLDRLLLRWGIAAHFLLFGMIALGMAGYYITEGWIGTKDLPKCVVYDFFIDKTHSLNRYIKNHHFLSDALLIAMGIVVDFASAFFVILTLAKRDIRPYLTFSIFFGLRQLLQGIIAVPPTPSPLWYYPGFPSLTQTYDISNDYFFSGHSGNCILVAIEFVLLQKFWPFILWSLVTVSVFILMIIMQIHYTMDVFTGIMTAICISHFGFLWAPQFSLFIKKILGIDR